MTLFGDDREAEILKAGLRWLTINGYTHWRNHVGGIQRSQAGKKMSWSKNPNKGMPDVMALLKRRPGVLVGIEFKTAKGRLTDEQVRWGQTLVDAGGCFIVVRNLLDLSSGISLFEHF